MFRVAVCGLSALLIIGAIAITGCCCCSSDVPKDKSVPVSTGFTNPVQVSIVGYNEDVMEPFLSRDGNLLLFNNRNDPGAITKLFYAKRINSTSFQFMGEINSVNTGTLNGVPSLDRDNNLYFTSTRSYNTTFSTIYTGKFDDGSVKAISLVEGISKKQAPWVNMDSEISADGRTLYYTENQFDAGGSPQTSSICIADKIGGAMFRPCANSSTIMRNVNAPGHLDYAPCTSADQLQLYFTRANLQDNDYQIMEATRSNTSEPFGTPERIGSITGNIKEAPTISPDGNSLYYHMLDNGTYHLFMVKRNNHNISENYHPASNFMNLPIMYANAVHKEAPAESRDIKKLRTCQLGVVSILL